ncbi:MAG TPA: hypothetical protein VGW33_03075 [Terriglobia bacterium]|nr:hypothetical protein [Terriglobia bacterium]
MPARHRSDSVPCHHIPLNGRGETIEAIEARNQPEKLDGAVKYWLQSAIGWLERDRRSNKGLTALLVYDRSEPLDVLGPILENLGLSVIRARTCREARQVLESVTLPSLLFTEPSLPDGTWADIFDRTGVGRAAIAVIVVSQQVDLKLCMEVIDRGAYDCLVPPVAVFDLAHIVRCAARRPAST